MPANRFNGFSDYGVGIGLRVPHYDHIFAEKPVVDWFEIISENYMVDGGRALKVLDQILERYRVVQHGVSMYFGSVQPADRDAFVAWIEHLEYNIYGLPRETLVLYLRVPPRQAQELVTRKSTRTYTKQKQDLQEASLHHLEAAAAMYDQLARRSNWATIACFDETRAAMRPQKQIATEILDAVLPVLSESAPKKKGA